MNLQTALFQQGMTQAQASVRVPIILGEQFAIKLFSAFKIAGAQSSLGAVTSFLLIDSLTGSAPVSARQSKPAASVRITI